MSAALELPTQQDDRRVDLNALYAESNIGEVIGQLDRDLAAAWASRRSRRRCT